MKGFEHTDAFNIQRAIIRFRSALLKIKLLDKHLIEIEKKLKKDDIDKETRKNLIASSSSLQVEKDTIICSEIRISIEYLDMVGYDHTHIKSYPFNL